MFKFQAIIQVLSTPYSFKKSARYAVVVVALQVIFGSAIAQAQLPLDPTRPAMQGTEVQTYTSSYITSSLPDPEFHLESILYSASRKLAIINGSQLFIGDSIAGAKVTHIAPDHVKLKIPGQALESSLHFNSGLQKERHN